MVQIRTVFFQGRFGFGFSFSFLLLVLALAGCSASSSRTETTTNEKDKQFRGIASTTQNQAPLPVEIAHDISRISAGGEIDYTVEAPMIGEPGRISGPESAPSPGPKTVTRNRTGIRYPQTGKTESYAVKSGDTLMKISFDKYGSVYRWREIYEANQDKIADYNALVAGTILTIHNVNYVVIRKNGKPYLIRVGDTLGTISRQFYGTKDNWKKIWKNNPELIRNPNQIYAGFTLYAPGLSQAETSLKSSQSNRFTGPAARKSAQSRALSVGSSAASSVGSSGDSRLPAAAKKP